MGEGGRDAETRAAHADRRGGRARNSLRSVRQAKDDRAENNGDGRWKKMAAPGRYLTIKYSIHTLNIVKCPTRENLGLSILIPEFPRRSPAKGYRNNPMPSLDT